MVTFNDFKKMTKCNDFLNISGGWAKRPSPVPGMTTVKFVKFFVARRHSRTWLGEMKKKIFT